MNPKTAVITGALGGIGRAIARHFAENGFNLVLVYRSSAEALPEFTESLADTQAQLHFIEADLEKSEAALKVVEETQHRFGSLDVLVNNAGGTVDGAFAMMVPEDYAHIIECNLIAPLRLTLTAAPHLILSKGAVVMMASLAGITGKEGQVPYATTKSGLIGATRLLARRLGPYGVRVNAVAPGFINTPMVKNLDPGMYKHVLEASATKRMGEPHEVAEVVGFLASKNSAYMNGAVLRVDGGFLR